MSSKSSAGWVPFLRSPDGQHGVLWLQLCDGVCQRRHEARSEQVSLFSGIELTRR